MSRVYEYYVHKRNRNKIHKIVDRDSKYMWNSVLHMRDYSFLFITHSTAYFTNSFGLKIFSFVLILSR